MKLWQKITAWCTGVTAVIAVIVAMLWGVPHYIDNQVTTKVKTEVTAILAEQRIDETEQLAEANQATNVAVLQRLDSMELRMIERDALFIDYLTKQAQRPDGT